MSFHKFGIAKRYFNIVTFRPPLVYKCHMFFCTTVRWNIYSAKQNQLTVFRVNAKLFLELAHGANSNGTLSKRAILAAHMTASPHCDLFVQFVARLPFLPDEPENMSGFVSYHDDR